MRLAYVDPHPVPGLTPSAMQMLQTVDGLGQAGADVTLITPASTLAAEAVLGRPLSPRVTLVPQFDPRKRWFFPFSTHKPFFWQAARLLARGGFDAVLVRNLKLADHLLRQRLPMPVYFETHEVFAQSFLEEHPGLPGNKQGKYRKLREREAFVYQQAAGVFALTSLLVDDICHDYGVSRERFHVLPDGFDPALADAALARFAKEGRQPGPPRVLYLGSLHPWKGVNTLIEAMPQVPPPVECWIAGGEEHRIAELKALAASLGVGERVRFLGKVPPTERFDLIAQADICALPLTETSIASRYTSPLKLFEYMAMGKPIVAADLPSIREVLVDGHNGLLFPVLDAFALAARLAMLLDDVELIRSITLNCAMEASAYSWVTRAKAIFVGVKNENCSSPLLGGRARYD